jgi:type IV secretion system protein VirB1
VTGALTAPAFAALLATCAPDAPADYMTKIVAHESGFAPYALRDNTTHTSAKPATYEAALVMAREMLRSGHSVDVGVAQINMANFGWLGLTLETALDPCRNIAAGARVFAAMSRYNTGDPRHGFVNGYVQRVLAQSTETRADPKQSRDPEEDDLPPDAERATTTYQGEK